MGLPNSYMSDNRTCYMVYLLRFFTYFYHRLCLVLMADRLDESMVLLKGEEGDFGKIADI
jgi:hypothetical protein